MKTTADIINHLENILLIDSLHIASYELHQLKEACDALELSVEILLIEGHYEYEQLERIRKDKQLAIEQQDFDAAAQIRKKEKAILETLKIDMPDLVFAKESFFEQKGNKLIGNITATKQHIKTAKLINSYFDQTDANEKNAQWYV